MEKPIHGGNLAWAAAQINCSPSLILDFSASINPLGPPTSAISAINQSLDTLKSYPDPDYRRLKRILAQEHQLSPEWILPGNGSAELLTWACRELAKSSVTCLINPAFGDYGRALQAFAANIKAFSLNLPLETEETGNFAQLPFPIPQVPSSMGLLLNNPHNPTGKLFACAEILPYLEKFALVVVDEAFMDFLPPREQQSLIDLVPNYPNLVILRSLTKFYSLPGLRLGYAIAHPERLQLWQQWRDPWSVNSLAAAVGEVVVRDRGFAQKTWNWLLKARQELFDGLEALPGLQPLEGAANYLLVKTDFPSSHLQIKLLQQDRILIRDCLSFPELGDSYFRVAVRTAEDNQRLLVALSQVIQQF